MPKSGRADPLTIEQTDKHLWTLTLTLITIFATGLALMMYPVVFSNTLAISGHDMRTYFTGFCVLSVLMVAYLLDRQLVIRQLRRRLYEEHRHVIRIRHEASADLLATLPGIDHFRDRLAMEFRRSSQTEVPLSLIIVHLRPAGDLARSAEVETAFGDAAKALTRRLRKEDSIYLFRPGVFAIVLPNVDTPDAQRLSARLTGGLQDAAGASMRFSSECRIINYPEHAATAREMEQAAQAYFPLSHSNAALPQPVPPEEHP